MEEEQKRDRENQKQRTRKLQRLITIRAEANDPHQSLAQIYKSKLKMFRYSPMSLPNPNPVAAQLLLVS